jgi:hypothetical protein
MHASTVPTDDPRGIRLLSLRFEERGKKPKNDSADCEKGLWESPSDFLPNFFHGGNLEKHGDGEYK